ncbi:MAG: methyltransferase domain-containing protein [Aliishimia sp.]
MTDRAALLRNRGRCQKAAMFLHEEAIADVQDRLSMVKKSFTTVGIVTGHPETWEIIEGAQIIADEDSLGLEDASFDLLIHAMTLHWANDPVGQLIQMRRALKPDGLMLAVFPGGQTLNELRACLSQAESETRGGLSPRVLPMGDIRDLGGLLQRAGFALPVADNITLTAEYDDAFALMRDLRAMGEGNALVARDRHATRRDVLMRTAEHYAMHFKGAQKPIQATFELMVLTGWAPSADQPQPLRPGSAKTRLAQALGTSETSLSD